MSTESIVKRSMVAARNVLHYPIPNGWLLEAESYALFAGCMADIDFKERTPQQLQVLSNFFNEAMYANRYVDPLVRRKAQDGGKGIHEIENFWCIPTHVKNLTNEAKASGFEQKAQESIGDWFHVNRVVNFYLHQLAIGKKFSEVSYGEVSNMMDQREVKIFTEIQKIISKRAELSPLEMSILLRSISSMGLARSMMILSENSADHVELNEKKLTRIGGMIMITQVMDDFGTPVKDLNAEIAGMVQVGLENSSASSVTKLKLDSNQTTKAISLAREIIGGCIESIDIDASQSWKRNVIKNGLILLGGVASGVMMKKYGGTEYDVKALFKGLVEAFGMGRASSREIRDTTIRVLKDSLSIMMSI